MTEIRFHSRDPRRSPRAWTVDERAGRVVAALLVLSGTLVAVGLFGAPDLVAFVVRSAERLALERTAERGRLAYESVRLRFHRLDRRVVADELFLARLAAVLDLPRPDGFPESTAAEEAATPTDLEVEVFRLGRRLRAMESLRRQIAMAQVGDPGRVPSRSPIDPSAAVPLSPFGPRVSPFTHRPEFLPGMELAAMVGTPVTATAGGRVVFAGRVPPSAGAAWRPFGTVAVVAHDATTRTVYGHLGSVRARRGQQLRRGETIGTVGANRFSPTPRLFYSVWKSEGRRFRPVDPRLHVLDADWIAPADLKGPVEPPREVELPDAFR